MPKQKTIPPSAWDGQRETLLDLSGMDHYNRWIYGIMRPFLGLRVLEIGCGTGNITRYLTDHGDVCAVDVNDQYLAAARKSLKGYRNVAYRRINLEGSLRSLKSFRPDTIVCVNVLEHLEHDRDALEECLNLLPGGGHLLIFVPALQGLFGSMDESYGHHRRYSRGGLVAKAEAAGLKTVECRYLNLPGILGWWLNGKILKRKVIPSGQMHLYDRWIPLVRRLEAMAPLPFGLSLFLAAYKPALPHQYKTDKYKD